MVNGKFYVHLFCHNRDKYKKGFVAQKNTPVLARRIEGQNLNPEEIKAFRAYTLTTVFEQEIYKT